MATIKTGDRITFQAACRWGNKTVTRVVNGFYQGRPTVRYGGYANFVVKNNEIIEVK